MNGRLARPGLAALGGIAAGLGQVPWSLWPLALAGLALVLHLIASAPTPRQGAGLAFIAGAAHFALVLSWIVEPFLIAPERHGWMAPFALALMAGGAALFWALPVWAMLRWRGGLAAMVLALALSDLVRGHLLTGFPWALFGHIWLDRPPAQLASLAGGYGLSLLTLTIAACLAGAPARPARALAALALIALPWGFGTWRLAQPLPPAPGITLRLVQPSAAQAGKWDPALARQHFAVLLGETAAAPRPDLVIWPETALPYLLESSPDIAGRIASAAAGVPVMLGLQRVEGARVFNALRVQDGAGARIAAYDKHHLVPFGEYLPFGDLAHDWLGISAFAAQAGRAYSAGPGPQVLDLGPLGQVLPLICYEAVFPAALRSAARAGWIVQITNDAWFGTRTGPFQHAALARLRALEQGLPLARVANTGITQMIDARGQVTAALPFGARGHLDAALPGPLPATPYALWGEAPVLVLLAGLAAWLLRAGRARRLDAAGPPA